ncbi:MAG: hypothetical protein R3E89_10555 [Thiolinea sp.]
MSKALAADVSKAASQRLKSWKGQAGRWLQLAMGWVCWPGCY